MKIDDKIIGDGHPCFIIAEIGINHSGSLDIAKKLIDVAIDAKADIVKFQKRTIELNYTMEELKQPRISPFGKTNGELKAALEFEQKEYEEIDKYCKDKNILWSASVWDIPSIDFLVQFDLPFIKIPSARNNDTELLKRVAETGKPVIVSCGMATLRNLYDIINIIPKESLALMVCTATYPAMIADLNLQRISRLKEWFHEISIPIPIGYSGHETGLWTTLCAVAMGANLIERHITLDRTNFGSDQAASIEPIGFKKLIREIRDFEIARGSHKLGMLPCEMEVARKLKRI